MRKVSTHTEWQGYEEGRRVNGLIRKKNRKGWIRDSGGMMTVEASILIPIILFIAAGAILLLLAEGKRETMRGDMYTALYTLPIAEEKDHSPGEELAGRVSEILQDTSAAELEAFAVGDDMSMTGSVRYFGVGKYDGKLPVFAGRERDCTESRLRRWQFYGDLAED